MTTTMASVSSRLASVIPISTPPLCPKTNAVQMIARAFYENFSYLALLTGVAAAMEGEH